jgi:hypothetical protein
LIIFFSENSSIYFGRMPPCSLSADKKEGLDDSNIDNLTGSMDERGGLNLGSSSMDVAAAQVNAELASLDPPR